MAGFRPNRVDPLFVKRQDWIVRFEPYEGDPDYPDGTEVWFRQYEDPLATTEIGVAVQGEIVDGGIRFKIESAITDDIPKGVYVRIYIKYPNSPTSDDYCFAKGRVQRDD